MWEMSLSSIFNYTHILPLWNKNGLQSFLYSSYLYWNNTLLSQVRWFPCNISNFWKITFYFWHHNNQECLWLHTSKLLFSLAHSSCHFTELKCLCLKYMLDQIFPCSLKAPLEEARETTQPLSLLSYPKYILCLA